MIDAQHNTRTSTVDQKAGFDAQLKELRAVGCEKLFQEQVSFVGERIQLAAALEYVREGDVLVVTKLDRLARSVADLMVTVQTLDRKNVGLRVLNLGMDTHTPTGKLMLTVLGGVAQFEREMMLERHAKALPKPRQRADTRGASRLHLNSGMRSCNWRRSERRKSASPASSTWARPPSIEFWPPPRPPSLNETIVLRTSASSNGTFGSYVVTTPNCTKNEPQRLDIPIATSQASG
jgi:hypothetical protein